MQSNKEELKKTLLDMLLEDKEFRYAVAGAIGYKELLDRFARVEERMAKNQANANRRFVRIEKEIRDLREEMNKLRQDMLEGFRRHDEEFAKMRQDMNEGFRRHDEELKRHWESIEKLRQDMNEGFRRHDEELKRHWESIEKLRQDMNEGFRRHDEEFARVWKSIEDLRRDMLEGFKRVDKRFERMDIKISALGARWGIMNEQSVREALKGMVGEELGYTISEWVAYDDEGYVYGYPSRVQLDIVVSDGKVIALEITSHVKKSDPIMLKKKAELYRKKEGKEIGRLVFVTPFIDDDAIEICNKFGIDVYTAS